MTPYFIRRLGSALAASTALAACRAAPPPPENLTARAPTPAERAAADSGRQRFEASPEAHRPVQLHGLTMVTIRPAPAYLDTAATPALRRLVAGFEGGLPAAHAAAIAAGFSVADRYSGCLVLDPATGAMYIPALGANQVGYVLLAPDAPPAMLDTIVPLPELNARLRSYRERARPRSPAS